MRGYYQGRYTDNDMITVQVELRQRIWRRIGCAVWGGAGNVFPSLSRFDWSQTLPNYGAGLRWELKKRVNVRLDYGFGKKTSGLLLTVYFFVALIIPNCVLANTEPYSVWTVEALILMPLGFYMMWSVALRRSGVMIWLAFPFIFFCAFQIVLLYLFGNSIIATDMFTNLLTTNPGEAGELLGNIYPSVVLVCVIYLPLLWLARSGTCCATRFSRSTSCTTSG